MKETLMKIKNIEKYFADHAKDEIIEGVISKLIELKINQIDQEITELRNDLKKFEDKYHLKSEQFITKFQEGEMKDNLDFTDWVAIYKMYHNRLKDKSLLSGKA